MVLTLVLPASLDLLLGRRSRRVEREEVAFVLASEVLSKVDDAGRRAHHHVLRLFELLYSRDFTGLDVLGLVAR